MCGRIRPGCYRVKACLQLLHACDPAFPVLRLVPQILGHLRMRKHQEALFIQRFDHHVGYLCGFENAVQAGYVLFLSHRSWACASPGDGAPRP